MDILSFVIGFLSIWWLWLPVVIILLYLTFQNHKKIKHLDAVDPILLVIEIPRTNDKKELAAEQMFASLHGILHSKKELAQNGLSQEHISFEIVAINKQIKFYIWTQRHLQSFVEGQIYAQYPSVQIYEAPKDYAARSLEGQAIYSVELGLQDNQALPIRTFESFDVDPLAAMTGTLAKLEQEGEEAWIQILARPIDDSWYRKSAAYVRRLKNGGGVELSSVFSMLGDFFALLWRPPQPSTGGAPILNERDTARIKAAEHKSTKLGYQVKIRIAYIGGSQQIAKMRVQNIVGTFKQFTAAHLNSFTQKKTQTGVDALINYQSRFFLDKGFVLNIEELASLYHLPHTSVETPNIVWANRKTTEPPANLPAITGESGNDSQISAFAVTNFRGENKQFGLHRADRGRHVYIIGQTGVGKSKLLELFTLSDIYQNQGFAIIDPHGDYAMSSLLFVPSSRIEDVVYFNPADSEFPMAFNPMEITDPAQRGHISSELVGVLKRMFGNSWGPRLEYILRYTLLALLESPGTTMLDITRMLTDPAFREKIVEQVTDPLVKSFWTNEFANWSERYANEAIAPVLNKVGAFTANPLIRNIIGQPKSAFNLRQIMDEGKIFVANLSRGLLGEDNAAILGALLVTKMQLAAMSRANVADASQRRPFYLYVDEFQNFATDSFAVILSEARKYGLNLTVANQYINQMSPAVRDAVFGNVGTLISFRVGANDAETLGKHFEPQIEGSDLPQLHNRNFVISMVIEGEKVPTFTGTTLSLPSSEQNYYAEIITYNRTHRSRPKAEVEAEVNKVVGFVEKTSQQPNTPSEVGEESANSPRRRRRRVRNQQSPTEEASQDVQTPPQLPAAPTEETPEYVVKIKN